VDELDVARVKAGQAVRLSFDALPEQVLTGTVELIEPLATRSSQGTTTYQVTVGFGAEKAAVLAGMTASVAIVTEQKSGVVLVPRRAVQSEGGKSYVLVAKEGPADPQTKAPANERREVVLGLSNAEQIEIVSGLKAGEQVLIQDVVSTFNPVGG
jgi:HlyD family secretion protein